MMSHVESIDAGPITSVQSLKTMGPPQGNQQEAARHPHHTLNIMRQLRCYLCDTPKQEYSLIHTFTEIVCRGCVNFEGPDRVEQLISEARRFKTSPEIYEPSPRAPLSLCTPATTTSSKPAATTTTTTTTASSRGAHRPSSPAPRDTDEQTRQAKQVQLHSPDSPAGLLLPAAAAASPSPIAPPQAPQAPVQQAISVPAGQCSPNSLAAAAAVAPHMLLRPGEPAPTGMMRYEPGLARAFAYAGLQPHHPGGTITLNTPAGPIPAYGQFDFFQPHPGGPICARSVATFGEPPPLAGGKTINPHQQQQQQQNGFAAQRTQPIQQQHSQSRQQQQQSDERQRQANYTNNHPFIFSQHPQHQAAMAAYNPSEFCLGNHPLSYQQATLAAPINGTTNVGTTIAQIPNNQLMLQQPPQQQQQQQQQQPQQQQQQHQRSQTNPDQARRGSERCCPQFEQHLLTRHLQQRTPERLPQILKEKAPDKTASMRKSAKHGPAAPILEEAPHSPAQMASLVGGRERRNSERDSSERSSPPSPTSSPKAPSSVLRSRKRHSQRRASANKEAALEIDLAGDEDALEANGLETDRGTGAGAHEKERSSQATKRPASGYSSARTSSLSPKRFHGGEVGRFSSQTAQVAASPRSPSPPHNHSTHSGGGGCRSSASRQHGITPMAHHEQRNQQNAMTCTAPLGRQQVSGHHHLGPEALHRNLTNDGCGDKLQALNLSHPLGGAQRAQPVPILNSALRGHANHQPSGLLETDTNGKAKGSRAATQARKEDAPDRSPSPTLATSVTPTPTTAATPTTTSTTTTTASTPTTTTTAATTATTTTTSSDSNQTPQGAAQSPAPLLPPQVPAQVQPLTLTLPSNKYDSLKCLNCTDRLEDRHFVQCPTVTAHKFCFGCSKQSIQRQRFDIQMAIDSGTHSRQETEKIYCPSGKKCLLTNERSPWTFMTNEIETIFRENSLNNGPTNKSHYLSKSNSKSNRAELQNYRDKS